ncbi:MAG: hypothetical protein ACREI2_12135 [Nitrospiraceae bacterium]
MKKPKAKQTLRPSRSFREMETYLSKQPDLREAMRLLDIGMEQYARSLSYLSHPHIFSRSDTKSS